MDMDFDTRLRHLEKKGRELMGRNWLPQELVALVVDVARRQLDAMGVASPGRVEEARLPGVDENLAGRPLVLREEFPFDPDQAAHLFRLFIDLAAEGAEPLAGAAKTFRDEHLEGLDLEEAFSAYLRGDNAYFEKWAERTPNSPRLLAFLVQAAMTPSLAAAATGLTEHLDKERAWRHGHCPVCGSLPLITCLRDKQGLRMATCSFCLTDYRVPRISCPFCGETDQSKLVVFDVPDEPGFKIEACETCRMYIKTVDFRALDKTSVPVLDDLESLPLDFLARKRHYTRPTLSAWGF